MSFLISLTFKLILLSYYSILFNIKIDLLLVTIKLKNYYNYNNINHIIIIEVYYTI